VEVAEQGEGNARYWVYTPAEPKPEKAPVVAFIHGYGALEPTGYVEWLHHTCRRGNIVIYPQYQADWAEPPANYATNSASAVITALAYLEADESRVQPIKEKFAIAGHSAGGVTCANVAADWETLKLPKPRAVMPVQPGRAFSFNSRAQKDGLIPLSDFSKMPADCLLLCVYGDSDVTVGAWCARKFFVDAGVSKENKNLIEFVSSEYGKEAQVAGHFTPAAPEGTPDFWDWYGYWKLLDGLTDAAFHGKNREYALGDTPQQKFMGNYSDGRPFEELKVWLGGEKVDPGAAYLPVFDRKGQRRKAAEEPAKSAD
jgi:acetyl esterase/lipase